MKPIIALSLGYTLIFSHQAASQEPVTVKLPVLVTPTVSGVHVPDGGVVRHGLCATAISQRSSPQKTSREILSAPRVSDQLCSKTEVDSVITYDIIHDNNPLKMVIHPNGVIEMTIVRMFDSNNADELHAAFPDLNTRLNAFPTKTDDDSRVAVRLEIETTYSFASAAKLKEDRIDLHRIYNRYTGTLAKHPSASGE